MKHNVSFSPEKRKDKEGAIIRKNVPLFADIRYAGQRLFYFTGYRIDKSNWKQGDKAKPAPDDQTAIKNTFATEGGRTVSASEVNRRVRLIRAALTSLFDNTQTAPDKSTIVKLLDHACNKGEQQTADTKTFLPMFRHYIQTSRLSEGRKKHAYSALNHWQRYADIKNITLTFEKITPDVLRAFEDFLLSEKKETATGSKEALRGKNTIHTTFSITRTFWNHARRELKPSGVNIPYPFDSYKVPAEVYGTPIYITRSERNELFDKKIENQRLAQVRDIFVFQCLTGARVGDLMKFTKANINDGSLYYIASKTKEKDGVTVEVPLSAKALEILQRYDIPDGRLLPFISEQKYNNYIKELFREAGLTRTVTRQNPTTREQETVRLCDIASSHHARKTFIGNLYGEFDRDIIASMSGHAKDSKAFSRYHDVDRGLKQKAARSQD